MGGCGLEVSGNWQAAAVKMVMNTEDLYKAGLFLTILGNVSLPSILLHRVICLLFSLAPAQHMLLVSLFALLGSSNKYNSVSLIVI